MTLSFKSLSLVEVKTILASAEKYSDNDRLNLLNFKKYFTEDNFGEKLWYGAFEDGRCMALSLLRHIPSNDIILLAEIQSFVKGYGKSLIWNILFKSKNIWWCADPTGGEDLVNYYRQFGLKEHLIKMSKWTNTPEYAFYKAIDNQHEMTIVKNLHNAEIEDNK